MLTLKRKILLELLGRETTISKIRLVKLVFLISRKVPSYHFVPYMWGPFSFELYHDLKWLEDKGWIEQGNDNISLIKELDTNITERAYSSIVKTLNKNSGKTDKDLMDSIYDTYPFYTIFSNYSKRMEHQKGESGIISMGYEGRTIDEYLCSLLENGVGVLFDVRKNAYSRKFGFSKRKLEDYSKNVDIEYIHIPELGIDSCSRKELECLDDYEKLFSIYERTLSEKEDHIEKIYEISKDKRSALMCFERDPRYCHRTIIANKIQERGVEVKNL